MRVRKTRHKRRSGTKTSRRAATKSRRPVRARRKVRSSRPRRKTSRLVSRAIGGQEKAPRHRKRARAVATRNPAREFVIEAYRPKGHKFFYYDGEQRLTAKRNDAARYKSGPEAHKARLLVARRAPAGIHWVRVCPA